MSQETLEKWLEKYRAQKEKTEYGKMEESTYRKKVVTIQNEIERLIKERDKAGYSIIKPEKRTKEGIKIQERIWDLQNKIQELYQKQKGEMKNEN